MKANIVCPKCGSKEFDLLSYRYDLGGDMRQKNKCGSCEFIWVVHVSGAK